jgi:hypothetical protein
VRCVPRLHRGQGKSCPFHLFRCVHIGVVAALVDAKSKKPDLGLQIGCGLWIVIACAAFRVFGWHIPSWVWYAALGAIASIAFQYALNFIVDSVADLARKIDTINGRLDGIDGRLSALEKQEKAQATSNVPARL